MNIAPGLAVPQTASSAANANEADRQAIISAGAERPPSRNGTATRYYDPSNAGTPNPAPGRTDLRSGRLDQPPRSRTPRIPAAPTLPPASTGSPGLLPLGSSPVIPRRPTTRRVQPDRVAARNPDQLHPDVRTGGQQAAQLPLRIHPGLVRAIEPRPHRRTAWVLPRRSRRSSSPRPRARAHRTATGSTRATPTAGCS